MKEEVRDKSKFKELLERLQQESWQLELLISGLALFGLWESQTMIDQFGIYMRLNTPESYRFYSIAIESVLNGGWILFMFNLLTHIIVRGLWIGAIGLRYVSGDINFDKLNYSEVFDNFYRKNVGSFDDYIERLEKLSSVLFAFTFLLFFFLVSLISTITFYALTSQILFNILGLESDSRMLGYVIYGLVFYGLALIVLIDFFSVGVLKKIRDKKISKLYFYIFRFYSIASLSFTYRSLLLNFLDTKYSKRFFFAAIPYAIFLLLFASLIGLNRESYFPEFERNSNYLQGINQAGINHIYYDDLRDTYAKTTKSSKSVQKLRIDLLSLSKYENEDKLDIFLQYMESDNELLRAKYPQINPINRKGLVHEIWYKKTLTDDKLLKFDGDLTKELRMVRNMVRKKELPKNEENLAALTQEEIDKYMSSSEEELPMIEQRLKNNSYQRRRDYQVERISTIRDALVAEHKILIDDTDYSDSLKCFFYVHPNLKERGLLCHLTIKHLESGIHQLTMIKNDYEKECQLNCRPYYRAINFYKR